jgi:hypothetical protein
MVKVTRKRYSADFKARVALEAIKGERTRLNWEAWRASDDDCGLEASGD